MRAAKGASLLFRIISAALLVLAPFDVVIQVRRLFIGVGALVCDLGMLWLVNAAIWALSPLYLGIADGTSIARIWTIQNNRLSEAVILSTGTPMDVPSAMPR